MIAKLHPFAWRDAVVEGFHRAFDIELRFSYPTRCSFSQLNVSVQKVRVSGFVVRQCADVGTVAHTLWFWAVELPWVVVVTTTANLEPVLFVGNQLSNLCRGRNEGSIYLPSGHLDLFCVTIRPF